MNRLVKFCLGTRLMVVSVVADATDSLDRSVLPIPEPKPPHSSVLDVHDATPPPRFEVKAPEAAPNVLIVLLDDMGFGVSSVFGGPVKMPTTELLASSGLRYNQFHTTGLCSPTRSALLTGRNHHINNMGANEEAATPFPGNTGQRPNSVAPLAEILRLNGYSTAFFGKNHETAIWEMNTSGPTDHWPTRSGFDKFYGFVGDASSQWSPLLYEDLTQIETPQDPHYHFMTDVTNQAVNWVRRQKALTPSKPFLIYFAPGATHAPHHVPKEWIAKYKGRFDQGWDKLRKETLARQLRLGVVPPGTTLAPKPAGIKDWDKLSPDEKKLFARQMEIYAGFAEYADTEIGRLISAISALGQLDNTLVFFILGDSGSSAEGGLNGMFNQYTVLNGGLESVSDMLKHYDDLGGPKAYNHFAAGWAVAGSTPYTWTKPVASNFGATRNGLVVYWPKGIKAKGELRSQFHHVIDIAPTVLQAAHLPEPKSVNGTEQEPIEGVSLAYSFAAPKAESQHKTQYFEILGNRALYSDGWLASAFHKAPWEAQAKTKLAEDHWALYDTRKDFSLAHDIAKENPQKLKELQDLFMREARQNHVLPLDDRSVERRYSSIVDRPDIREGRTSMTLYPDMQGIPETAFLNLKNTSHSITAQLEIPKIGAKGVVIAQGGRFGGWSLYFDKAGRPTYTYNLVGLLQTSIAPSKSLPQGKTTLRFEFSYDGNGWGKGGTGILFANDKPIAQGRIEHTEALVFSMEETTDVGRDNGTPVTEAYKQWDNSFTGKILSVQIDSHANEPISKEEEAARKNAAFKKSMMD